MNVHKREHILEGAGQAEKNEQACRVLSFVNSTKYKIKEILKLNFYHLESTVSILVIPLQKGQEEPRKVAIKI